MQLYLFKHLEPEFNYRDCDKIKQVFHSWDKWEDFPFGFYNNISGRNKLKMVKKVVEFFSNHEETRVYMCKVVSEWSFSCEHNFTNPSINKIAYLGQASLSLAYNIPSTITMEAWSKVPKEHQEKANKIADNCINEWFKNYLLCQK